MRVLALAVLVGCGAPAASGPAWPKSAGIHEPDPDIPDGGESIEPPVGAVAAVEKSAEPTPAATPAAAAIDPDPDDPAAAAAAAAAAALESSLSPDGDLEEIVIEIGGDGGDGGDGDGD